jgi:Holliday junction resolvase-like predicted endonuclease
VDDPAEVQRERPGGAYGKRGEAVTDRGHRRGSRTANVWLGSHGTWAEERLPSASAQAKGALRARRQGRSPWGLPSSSTSPDTSPSTGRIWW